MFTWAKQFPPFQHLPNKSRGGKTGSRVYIYQKLFIKASFVRFFFIFLLLFPPTPSFPLKKPHTQASVRGINEKIEIIKDKYNLLCFYDTSEAGEMTLCQPQKKKNSSSSSISHRSKGERKTLSRITSWLYDIHNKWRAKRRKRLFSDKEIIARKCTAWTSTSFFFYHSFHPSMRCS